MSELDYKLTLWFEKHERVWKTIAWIVGIVWTAAIVVGVILQLAH